MRITVLRYVYDYKILQAEQLLDIYYQTTEIASELQKLRMNVVLFQRFRSDLPIKKKGVIFYFIADIYNAFFRPWQVPLRLHQMINNFCPVRAHIHRFGYPLQTVLLRARLAFGVMPIVPDIPSYRV